MKDRDRECRQADRNTDRDGGIRDRQKHAGRQEHRQRQDRQTQA